MSLRRLCLGAFAAFTVASVRADFVAPVPTAPGSEVTIKLSTPAASLPRFGFAPVRVSIENTAAQERTWHVGFQAGMRNQVPGVSSTDRTITVPAGQTRDTWIFVPLAEPSVSAAQVVAPGSPTPVASGPSGMPPARVTINKTATGTKVTSVRLSPSGAPMMTEETEIDATTGAMKRTMTSNSGSTNTSISTPPPGFTVTYTINPVTGSVASNSSMGAGVRPSGMAGALTTPTRVNIVTSTAPSPGPGGVTTISSLSSGSRGGPAPNTKVTIIDTPVGTKVTRTMEVGGRVMMTTEREIDASTGVMTTTTTTPSGSSQPPLMSPPARPGTEVIFTIDPNSGNVSTRSQPSSILNGAPKITIVKAAGASTPPVMISSTGPVAPPSIINANIPPTAIAVEFTGPGVAGARVMLPGTVSGSQMRPFAVSTSLDATVRAKLAAVVRGAPNLSAVEVAQLPADWRVWSSFAGLILTSDEFAALDAWRRASLRGWVGLGGRLWLSPAASGQEHVEKFGAGAITTLAEPLTIDPAASAPAATAPVASGPAQVVTRASVRGGAVNPLPGIDPAAVELWITKIQVYGGTPGLPEREALSLDKTPLGDAVQPPDTANTWLSIFLVGFALVVGPVNLFVFAPATRRHRLFLTTPLIALVASIVLGVAIVMQDGLGGNGMRVALVSLLPGENEAAVFQEQTARTGFLARRTFALADDTQMTVLAVDDSDPRNSFTPVNADLARVDGRASGDWFRSRSRQGQLLQRLTPTRGRIERVGTAPDGAPIVQSSLATTLRSFVCVGDDDALWTVPELAPGKRTTLTRGGQWMAAGKLVPGGSRRLMITLAAATPKQAGRWSARGGATDLAPIATLTSVRWTDADVLYTGALEGATAPAKEATP